MPELVAPTVRVHQSFLDAMREFADEGRGAEGDDTMVGDDLRALADRWHEPEEFAAFVERLLAEALEDTPRPTGWVPCTTLWWVDGDTYLGRIAVRHRLTDRLREVGGHIGYDVRRSARRRGHATQMLRRTLRAAKTSASQRHQCLRASARGVGTCSSQRGRSPLRGLSGRAAAGSCLPAPRLPRACRPG